MTDQSANSPRLLRLSRILAPNGPIPVSRSTWWAGVKSGRFPPPMKLGPRTTVWRSEDIERLVQDGAVRHDGRAAVETTPQSDS